MCIRDRSDEPVISLAAGAASDVSALLDAVQFDDEVVAESEGEASTDGTTETPNEETSAPE